MNPWLYAALCVVVPVVWGVGIAVLSNAAERWLSRSRARLPGDRDSKGPSDSSGSPLPPIDYHI